MIYQQPTIGDAFGESMRRCWQAGAERRMTFHVVERDDGCIEVCDASRFVTGWSDLERVACEQVKGSILDIGCGAGRHAVPLTERGADVLGLEPSPGAAEVARERGAAVSQGVLQKIEKATTGPVDTFLMLGGNLGLLGSAEAAPHLLQRLAEIASPGAVLYGTSRDPSDTDNPAHLAYHERNRARGLLPGEVNIRIRIGHLASEWRPWMLVSPDELAGLVTPTSWDLDGIEQTGANFLARLVLRTR